MSYVRDLWKDPARRGRGKRWLAIWTGPDGRRQSQAFARKGDASQHVRAHGADALRDWRAGLVAEETAALRARLDQETSALRARIDRFATSGDGFDPRGYCVYLLWAAQGDAAPMYVGQSRNVLARLGTHLSEPAKRAGVGWITVMRCASEADMIRAEAELIRKYRPIWNRHIPAVPVAVPGDAA